MFSAPWTPMVATSSPRTKMGRSPCPPPAPPPPNHACVQNLTALIAFWVVFGVAVLVSGFNYVNRNVKKEA